MKKYFIALAAMTLFSFAAMSQFKQQATPAMPNTPGLSEKQMKNMKPKIGIKVGYNYARLAGTSMQSFSPGSHNGFMISGFYAPGQGSGVGYRTELIFSRQGFSFDENGQMQNIGQDYIYMPHLTTFSIGRFVQLQAGMQVGYLISATKTPDQKSSSGSEQETNVTDYMNRIDYGAAGGLEVYPVAGLIIGARYNMSLGNVYKQDYTAPTTGGIPTMPSPFPFNPSDVKSKNAVIQVFIGYKF
jgi:hypothetical protein